MILDACCGSKMFYFSKTNPSVLFSDQRKENHVLCDGRDLEIKPDVQADFKQLPFLSEIFTLVIFDPPHFKHAGDNSWMFKKYGRLDKDTWKENFKQGQTMHLKLTSSQKLQKLLRLRFTEK